MRGIHRKLAVVVAVALLAPAVTTEAASAAEPSATQQYVTGFGSLLVTPVYGAFKLAFATVGVVVGGFTWLFTGADVESAQKVWDTTIKGTYVISPAELTGDRPIEFTGRTADSDRRGSR